MCSEHFCSVRQSEAIFHFESLFTRLPSGRDACIVWAKKRQSTYTAACIANIWINCHKCVERNLHRLSNLIQKGGWPFFQGLTLGTFLTRQHFFLSGSRFLGSRFWASFEPQNANARNDTRNYFIFSVWQCNVLTSIKHKCIRPLDGNLREF